MQTDAFPNHGYEWIAAAESDAAHAAESDLMSQGYSTAFHPADSPAVFAARHQDVCETDIGAALPSPPSTPGLRRTRERHLPPGLPPLSPSWSTGRPGQRAFPTSTLGEPPPTTPTTLSADTPTRSGRTRRTTADVRPRPRLPSKITPAATPLSLEPFSQGDGPTPLRLLSLPSCMSTHGGRAGAVPPPLLPLRPPQCRPAQAQSCLPQATFPSPPSLRHVY